MHSKEAIIIHGAYRSLAGAVQSIEGILGNDNDLTDKQYKRLDKAVTVIKIGMKLIKFALRTLGVSKPKDA